MLKAVIIGTAGHYDYALSAIKEGASAKIVALAPGPDGVLNNQRLKANDIKIYQDYLTMLDEVKPDVAIINPRFDYISLCAIEALNRGISIFCEKPISITWEGLEGIEAAAKKSGCRVCAMMGMRNEVPFYSLKQILMQNQLGNIRLIHAQKSYKLGVRPMFYHNRETYGGTIPWVGSHPIDMIYWLTGRKRYESVTAVHSTADNRDHGELETSATMLFKMTDDVLCTVNLDYLRPQSSKSHGDDRIRVMGENGWAEIVGDKLYLNGENVAATIPEGNIFYDFCRELDGGEPCSISNDDSFYVTKICLHARDSADNNTQISIGE